MSLIDISYYNISLIYDLMHSPTPANEILGYALKKLKFCRNYNNYLDEFYFKCTV